MVSKIIWDRIKESGRKMKELDKQVEIYNFTVGTTIWQIIVAIFLSAGFFFLGAEVYPLFVICIVIIIIILIVLIKEYIKVVNKVIAREMDLELSDWKKYKKLSDQNKTTEANQLLNNIIIKRTSKEIQKAEDLEGKTRSILKILRLVEEKNLEDGEIAQIANANKLSLNYYSMTQSELETLIKLLSNSSKKDKRKLRQYGVKPKR